MTWNTLDFHPSSDAGYCGLLGLNGSREANLITRYCDCLVVVGSHLSKQLTGDDLTKFAENSQIFIIDIDDDEFYRFQNHGRITCINFDLRNNLLVENLMQAFVSCPSEWLNFVLDLKEFRTKGIEECVLAAIPKGSVNQYEVYESINENMEPNDIFVVDGGGNVLFSALANIRVNGTQNRVITDAGTACMGSGLPQSIGAAKAGKGRVICFIGDGSMMFNLQEVQTILHHWLDIVVIIFNNDGYSAIKNTEDAFFTNRFGVSADSGISFPDFSKLLPSFGMPYHRIAEAGFNQYLKELLSENKVAKGPMVIEVMISEKTPLVPCGGFRRNADGVLSRRATWDMYPDINLQPLENKS
jgi:acetolactate synthase-1/2/3 large subunit